MKRRITVSGIGAVGNQDLPIKGHESGPISISAPSEYSEWFNLISTHLGGLGARLAPLKKDMPNAVITTNPVEKIERLMQNFFGHLETLQLHCSKDGGNSLDPALFYEYLTNAFAKIVKIIESKDARLFYGDDDRAVILENCQRNLCFIATVLPGVSAEFEKFISDPANGGVVPGKLLPLDEVTGPRRTKTQPFIDVTVSSPDSSPVSEAVPSSSRKRNSSIPLSAEQLYPAKARRDTVRPTAGRRETLPGLDDLPRQLEAKRESGVVPVGETVIDQSEGATPEHTGVTTSMLPPPMVEAMAEHEMQKKLDALQRGAFKEFADSFVQEFEIYLGQYREKYHAAKNLIDSQNADPEQRKKDIAEGESLIASLDELMIDPEDIADIAYGLTIEKMNNSSENYPQFSEFFLERGIVDYDVRFKQHMKVVFEEKGREFAEVCVPALLKRMVTAQGIKRDLGIHHREILGALDAGVDVPKDLATIHELIRQIAEKDAAILFEDWPDKLATALASQTFLSLGESLYRSNKSPLIWGLYFYQEKKRELADQVYQQIFDAYLPFCQEYQDELRAGVRDHLAQITAAYAEEVGANSTVSLQPADLSSTTEVTETELDALELAALEEALEEGVTFETGEAGVTEEELAEIARLENAANFNGVDDNANGSHVDERISDLGLGMASQYLKTPVIFADQDPTFRDADIRIPFPKIVDGSGALQTPSVIVDGVDVAVEAGEKLPPLPDVIDPLHYMHEKDFMKWIVQMYKSDDKVAELDGYAMSVSNLGGFIMAKDGWIVFQDKTTETIHSIDEYGKDKEKTVEKVLGKWYFRPPNTLFPVYRPADGNETTEPLSMTSEQVQDFYNKMPRRQLKALYARSFGSEERLHDAFAGIADDAPIFDLAPTLEVLGFANDSSGSIETPSQTPTNNMEVADGAMNNDEFVELPSAKDELGDANEADRPTLVTERTKKRRGLKYALAAAAMAAMGAIGYTGYKAVQSDSQEGPVASASVANADSAKPAESVSVAEVKSAQPQPTMTAPPVQTTQPPTAPVGPSVKIEDLPVRTYVSNEVLEKIPSTYTRKVVETGKYTVENNGLGWAAQIATPFTRIASPKQQAQILDLQYELNVGLYASAVKKYENARNVNAILMDPRHPEYNRVKFLIKSNVMGNPYKWDWEIFSRKTGKTWDVQKAYEYYQLFEKEAMDRNMDRHSPGVLHTGAWGGDVVEVYKDAKFMTYMVDVAGIVGIDLKPPTTGSVDPSILHNQVPGAPGNTPGVDQQPGSNQEIQNKTGFLNPTIPGNLNFGFGSIYGNSGLAEQPRYTLDFKPAAAEVELASFDVDLSDLEPGVQALAGLEDVSVDVDLSELNANTLADTSLDDSIDVDLSDLEEAAFDAQWDTIAAQHEVAQATPSLEETVTRVKSNRREALMKHGEVWVPSLSDDLSGSAMLAFENGFLKECTSESQQQKVRAILSKIRFGHLESYEALEDGSTYAKLSEKDMNALLAAVNQPSLEDQLAEIDAGWNLDASETTPESELIVDVSRKVNQRVGVVRLSA